MKERPILFSGPMVRALLDGSKTQTRRAIKTMPENHSAITSFCHVDGQSWRLFGDRGTWMEVRCPYGQPGDRLWVREAWAETRPFGIPWPATMTVYREGDNRTDYGGPWKPSIHMKRSASRITLEITEVRVERLQGISDADAQAEGCPCYVCGGAMDGLSESDCHCFHKKAKASDFRNLWEQINGLGSWAANPWVWAVTFRRLP